MADFSKLKKLAEQAPLEKAAKLANKEKSMLDKGLDLLAAPQKYASKKLAEAAGLKPGDSSEQNFAALADVGAEKLGLPDNTATNIAKAIAVAGAETFADPLGLIPFGKIAKGIKGLKTGVAGVAQIAEKGGALKKAIEVAEAGKLTKAQALENIANRLKNAPAKPDWAAAYKKPGLRPELQGKNSTEIWKDVAKQQGGSGAIPQGPGTLASWEEVLAKDIASKKAAAHAKKLKGGK